MIKSVLLVGIGSAFGGIARYIITRYFQHTTTCSFPIGTIMVNVVGCLILGILYGLLERGNLLNTNLKLLLTVGFCGGFTTFSTFIGENFQILKDGNILLGFAYLSASIILGYLFLYLGYSIIKML